MYLVLFGVGLLVTAAGFLTIGFGIPINAFSLGNTLIVAGTVAVMGGLVLIGLAAAVRQLNRIAEALNSRSLDGRAATRSAAAAEESLVPPTARIPQAPARTPAPPKPVEAVMPRPPEPRQPEPRPAAEPRFPAASSDASGTSGPLDWLRSKPKASGDAPPSHEPAVMEVPDEAPLSPRAPQRPMFSPPPFSIPPEVEPKAWSPSRSNGSAEPMPEAPHAPASHSEQVARMSPSPEHPKDTAHDTGKPGGKDAGLFDVVWPDARSKPMSAGEPGKREPMPQRPREEKRAEPAPDRPSAILKSGVIDGMAYTLYVDGSIEAELAQGTVKFASVDALRAHLEKSV